MKRVIGLIIGIITLLSFTACTEMLDQMNGDGQGTNTTFTVEEKLVFTTAMNGLAGEVNGITGVTATTSYTDVELRITANVDETYPGGGSFSNGVGAYYMKVTKADTGKFNLYSADPVNGETQELTAVTQAEVLARFTIE